MSTCYQAASEGQIHANHSGWIKSLNPKPLTLLADLKVCHHAPLEGGRAGVSATDDWGVEATLGRVGQCEGLPVEGNAHHQLPRVGTTLHPVLEGKLCVLAGIPEGERR